VFRDDLGDTAQEEWQLLCEAVAALVQVLHTATRYPLVIVVLCFASGMMLSTDVEHAALPGIDACAHLFMYSWVGFADVITARCAGQSDCKTTCTSCTQPCTTTPP
jgi:hypothetical protein